MCYTSGKSLKILKMVKTILFYFNTHYFMLILIEAENPEVLVWPQYSFIYTQKHSGSRRMWKSFSFWCGFGFLVSLLTSWAVVKATIHSAFLSFGMGVWECKTLPPIIFFHQSHPLLLAKIRLLSNTVSSSESITGRKANCLVYHVETAYF